MLICLAKFGLRLADFDEVRSGLNTVEAHQRPAPRETSSKTIGSTPHSSFRDRTAMEPVMSRPGLIRLHLVNLRAKSCVKSESLSCAFPGGHLPLFVRFPGGSQVTGLLLSLN